jgi:hypothetical protein
MKINVTHELQTILGHRNTRMAFALHVYVSKHLTHPQPEELMRRMAELFVAPEDRDVVLAELQRLAQLLWQDPEGFYSLANLFLQSEKRFPVIVFALEGSA